MYVCIKYKSISINLLLLLPAGEETGISSYMTWREEEQGHLGRTPWVGEPGEEKGQAGCHGNDRGIALLSTFERRATAGQGGGRRAGGRSRSSNACLASSCLLLPTSIPAGELPGGEGERLSLGRTVLMLPGGTGTDHVLLRRQTFS